MMDPYLAAVGEIRDAERLIARDTSATPPLSDLAQEILHMPRRARRRLAAESRRTTRRANGGNQR